MDLREGPAATVRARGKMRPEAARALCGAPARTLPARPENCSSASPCDRMPMKAIPAPPLILIPAQFRFGFLMILLHPVAAVGILHQHGQGPGCREGTPEILPIPRLAPSGAFPNQPTH